MARISNGLGSGAASSKAPRTASNTPNGASKTPKSSLASFGAPSPNQNVSANPGASIPAGGQNSAQQNIQKSAATKTPNKVTSKPAAKAPSKKPFLSKTAVKVNLDPNAETITLRRISPASAARVGFFLAIALGIIMVVAVAIFWIMLDKSGIIFQFSQALLSSGLGINLTDTFAIGKVVLVAAMLACLNVVLITILAAILASIFNAVTRVSGGLKLQFSRD
jgi:hypothetical protein